MTNFFIDQYILNIVLSLIDKRTAASYRSSGHRTMNCICPRCAIAITSI